MVANAADLLRLARAGDPAAQVDLALRYYRGDGVRCSPRAYLDWVKRAAAAGDAEAFWLLGCMADDGLRDRRGILLVTQNRKRAAQLYRRAALLGDGAAMISFGVMLDTGKGVRRDVQAARYWYRQALRHGQALALNNLATWYRDRGDQRRAFLWNRRAAGPTDGDAHVDVGYAYQYGIGVRRNARAAKVAYWAAIRSKAITELGTEEAKYHLAVLLLDEGRTTNVARARELLRAASADDDYPAAAKALHRLERGIPPDPCRCRRGLHRSVRGQVSCPHHPARGRRQAGAALTTARHTGHRIGTR
jgi:uncharacterized protein